MPSIYADLLARAREALTKSEGATFAQATADLGSRLVSSGFDGVTGDPTPRVRRCTDALRALLGRVAFMVPPGPRDLEAVAAVERACANADTRAATYGYPRLPEPQDSTETGRKPEPSRTPTRRRRAPGPPTGRHGGADPLDTSGDGRAGS